MISWANPAFLAAGAALTAAALVLHLLTRQPSPKRPLPTAQFLSPDDRRHLRFQRRPRDPLLLLLRTALALCLAAVFAGPTWAPRPAGDVHVILVDAGADARADRIAAGELLVEVEATSLEDRTIVLAYGLAGPARVISPNDVRDLEPGTEPAPLEHGLQALRELARREGFASVRTTWLARPSWSAWSPGVGQLRAKFWPGRLELVAVPPVVPLVAGEPEAGPSRRPRAHLPPAAADGALERAAVSIGFDTGGAEAGREDAAAILLASPSSQELERRIDQARRGATIVMWGALPEPSGPRPALPWLPAGAPAATQTDLLLSTGAIVDGPISWQGGAPSLGAQVVAVFGDATPAAAALPHGTGCMAYSSVALDGDALTGSDRFPTFLAALVDACRVPAAGANPLDLGALNTLLAPDLPKTVVAASLPPMSTGDRGLARWFAVLVLLLLVAEIGWLRRSVT